MHQNAAGQLQKQPTKSLKLSKLNFAIPLMATAGIMALGVGFINYNPEDFASASNDSTIKSTISYSDEYITISNNSVIDLGSSEVTVDSSYVYATDNVTVSTNVPTGYDLYLSSSNNESASLKNPDSYTEIAATSGTGGSGGTPKALDPDSYGYAVSSSLIGNTSFDADYASPTATSKWAGIPTGTSDRIHSTSTATPDGDTTAVHYGANLTNYLAPGEYTGKVTYSAVVTPQDNDIAATVTPTSGVYKDELTIVSGPRISSYHNLQSEDVSIIFAKNKTPKGYCDIKTIDTSNNYLLTTCTAPNLAADTYDIEIIAPRYGFKDTIISGYTSIVYTTIDYDFHMQIPKIAATCSSLTETTSSSNYTTYTGFDSRNSQPYYIRKLTFNDKTYCLMVENLYLIGDTKLTKEDSNVLSDYTLPSSTTTGFYTSDIVPQMNDGDRYRSNDKTTDGSYYSWCSAVANTGGCYGLDTNESNKVTDATSSICPKGWRLPTHTEWNALYSRINAIGVKNFFANADGDPMIPVYGYYTNSKLSGTAGADGNAGANYAYAYWWSSTQNNQQNAYALRANGLTLKDSTSHSKYDGNHVRCLVEAQQ